MHKNFFLVKLTICLNLFTHGEVYFSLYFSLCHAVGFHQMPYDSFFFLPFIVDNKSLLLGVRPWVPPELVVCLPPETLPLPRKLLEALGTVLKGASYSRAPDSKGPLKVKIRMPTLLLEALAHPKADHSVCSKSPPVCLGFCRACWPSVCCGCVVGSWPAQGLQWVPRISVLFPNPLDARRPQSQRFPGLPTLPRVLFCPCALDFIFCHPEHLLEIIWSEIFCSLMILADKRESLV